MKKRMKMRKESLITVSKVTSMEKLPVRAVHFGDTGTPLDSKEGR